MKTIKKLPINNTNIDDDDIDLTGVDTRTFAESMLDKDIKTVLRYFSYPILLGFIMSLIITFVVTLFTGANTNGLVEKVSCHIVKTAPIHHPTKTHRG